MKKLLTSGLILGFMFLFNYCNAGAISTVGFPEIVTSDDVTMNWLNNFRNTVVDTLNSFPGDNIQTGTIVTGAMADNANPEIRWGEAFNEFVYTGLIPPTTVGTLISTTTAGTAYIKNDTTGKMTRVVKDATANTYTATMYTYVDLSSTGVYTYSETTIGADEPAITANSIRLCRVTTDGTKISAVRDDRVLGIQLATNEDFYLKGMKLDFGGTTTVTCDDGVVYVGSTRINKVVATGLDVSNSGDYLTGVSERGTSKWLYVYCDTSGSIKFDDNAADYHDTIGTTVGELYYYKNGTKYWRKLGQVYLNATGLGEVSDGNFIAGDINQFSTKSLWVVYASATGAVLNSYPAGITVTNTGVGDETVNFPFNFANVNYCVQLTCKDNYRTSYGTKAVGSLQITTVQWDNTFIDSSEVSVFVF